MKALVIHGKQDLREQEWATPEPQDGQVRVRIAWAVSAAPIFITITKGPMAPLWFVNRWCRAMSFRAPSISTLPASWPRGRR